MLKALQNARKHSDSYVFSYLFNILLFKSTF